MPSKPTFLKSFIITGIILLSLSFLLHVVVSPYRFKSNWSRPKASGTGFTARTYFLSITRSQKEVHPRVYRPKGFELLVSFRGDWWGGPHRNPNGLFWIPTIFFYSFILWPFLQKFIHQKLHRRWVLHGGFERQKNLWIRLLAPIADRIKADLFAGGSGNS
jgi:hypothetical protein